MELAAEVVVAVVVVVFVVEVAESFVAGLVSSPFDVAGSELNVVDLLAFAPFDPPIPASFFNFLRPFRSIWLRR